MKQELLTVKQVQARLNCSRSFIYILMDSGELPFVNLSETRGRRVPERALDRFIRRKMALAGAN